MKTAVKMALLVALALLVPCRAYAKAYFAPVDEMIRDADAIAVVTIVGMKPAKAEERDLEYKDMVASIEVKEIIKGDLANVTSIYIPNFFPCAIVDVTLGDHLVFLKQRDGVMTNSNWHLSLRRMNGNVVPWFSEQRKGFSDIPLKEVKEQITKQLSEPGHERP